MDTQITFGGSSMAGILGVSPWKTPYSVFMDLVGKEKQKKGLPLKIGNALENLVLQEWSEARGMPFLPASEVTHPELPWALAHLDASAADETGLFPIEAKTAGLESADEWTDAIDGIPDHYIPQTQFYMFMTGAKKCEVPYIIGNKIFDIKLILADTKFQGLMIEKASKFYRDHILKCIPPAPTNPEERISAAKWRHPLSNGVVLPFTPEARTALEDYLKLKKATASAKAKLIETIGPNDGFEGDGLKVTYRYVRGRTTTAWKAVATELRAAADLIKRHSNTGEASKRLLTGDKDEE